MIGEELADELDQRDGRRMEMVQRLYESRRMMTHEQRLNPRDGTFIIDIEWLRQLDFFLNGIFEELPGPVRPPPLQPVLREGEDFCFVVSEAVEIFQRELLGHAVLRYKKHLKGGSMIQWADGEPSHVLVDITANYSGATIHEGEVYVSVCGSRTLRDCVMETLNVLPLELRDAMGKVVDWDCNLWQWWVFAPREFLGSMGVVKLFVTPVETTAGAMQLRFRPMLPHPVA